MKRVIVTEEQFNESLRQYEQDEPKVISNIRDTVHGNKLMQVKIIAKNAILQAFYLGGEYKTIFGNLDQQKIILKELNELVNEIDNVK